MHSTHEIKSALEAEGVEIDERITRALRKLANPGGCHKCGANTLVGVEGTVKNKTVIKSACCGTVIGN